MSICTVHSPVYISKRQHWRCLRTRCSDWRSPKWACFAKTHGRDDTFNPLQSVRRELCALEDWKDMAELCAPSLYLCPFARCRRPFANNTSPLFATTNMKYLIPWRKSETIDHFTSFWTNTCEWTLHTSIRDNKCTYCLPGELLGWNFTGFLRCHSCVKPFVDPSKIDKLNIDTSRAVEIGTDSALCLPKSVRKYLCFHY